MDNYSKIQKDNKIIYSRGNVLKEVLIIDGLMISAVLAVFITGFVRIFILNESQDLIDYVIVSALYLFLCYSIFYFSR